jgi:quercetin dioxygenase-like cupin family protein
MKKKYKVDNIRNYSNTRGWICGHFWPEGNLLHNKNLEVKLNTLEPGESEEEHRHFVGTEVMIVVGGKMKYVIGGEEHVLGAGDFVYLESGVREGIIEVLEPTTLVSARSPSVANNKIIEK